MAGSLKRKLKTRIDHKKYKILKEIDRESSCASAAKNYKIPKQSLSHWLKDKQKIYATVESNSSTTKRQRGCQSPYEFVDQACHTWLINTRHGKIPISATVLKTKTLYFYPIRIPYTHVFQVPLSTDR